MLKLTSLFSLGPRIASNRCLQSEFLHVRARVSILLTTLCLLSGLDRTVEASLHVASDDSNLLERGSLVAYGRITSVTRAPTATVQSDATLVIEEVVRGFVPSSTILVRTRGGKIDANRALTVLGVGHLRSGDRVLLFLEEEAGVFRLVDRALGVFWEVQGNSNHFLVRHQPAPAGGPNEEDSSGRLWLRNSERFRAWLHDLEAGLERSPDYWQPVPSSSLTLPRFGILTGRGARFNADDRDAVRFLYPLDFESPSTPPEAPSDLVASALSTHEVELRWRDNSEDETTFEIEAREVFGSYQTLFTLPKDRERVVVRQLPEGAVRMFHLRARNEAGPSDFSNEVLETA